MYLPTFKFLSDNVAIPLLLVFAVYFLFLNLKVIFLFFKILPFLSTNFTVNVVTFAFFLEIFLAVNVGLKVIVLDTL